MRWPGRPAKPGVFACWSRSITVRRKTSSSAAGWRRSKRVSQGGATQLWIPVSSEMEVRYG